jgi:phenylalanyl-tRNA synthetase beta chain
MKASVRWLRELCPQLPDDAAAIAARLTGAGLEVESTHAYGLGAEACVVASVVATRPHPSRSGLRLVTVERGGGTQLVVCGAPNVPEPGGLVVLAPLGAHLPAKGTTIEARTIAGVPSEGMLCSEAELGLREGGDASDGILVLPPATATPGAPLVRALPAVRDTVLEIGLTPNRPDGLGHVGLAREAAALFEVPFSLVEPAASDGERAESVSKFVSIHIEDAERCPHYGAAVLVDATIGPSPLETCWRLSSLGLRPISNVVDVTNLAMLEFGHPMHAFDLDKVRGRAIVVRRAKAGEKLRTLDGVDRVLVDDDLVIADGEGPVALAGVMGGGDSEIGPTTRRVLLECAYFEPRGVRRAARRYGLHTEAGHRFERGVDWGDTRAVLARARRLVVDLAGAVAAGPAEVTEARPMQARTVTLRNERIRDVLGLAIEPADAGAALTRLGFSAREVQERASRPGVEVWQVPSFRPDVSREVDLIEEIARVRGFDAIPAELPAIQASRDAAPRQGLVRRAREAARGLGLSEAVTYSFVSPGDLAAVGAPPAAVTLLNPMSEEQSAMRTSLLPGLIRAFAHACRHGERNARLFTVGSVFLATPSPEAAPLPEERLAFAALLAGDRDGWLSRPRSADVWDAKGVAQGFVARLIRRDASVSPAQGDRPAVLHPRGAAWLEVNGKRVGCFGPLHSDVADRFEVGDAMLVELDLAALAGIAPASLRFDPLPRFPSSTRDLAVIVRDDVVAGDVEHAARDAAGNLADRVTLFDRFVGGSVPPGHASLGLRVVYRAADRTLTDAEVDARHAEVVSAVQSHFGATLRS